MEALGINIVNIFIYMFLFFILYWVIHKYLISKLLVILEKRKVEIQKGLDASNQAEKKLSDADLESKKVVEKALIEKREEIAKSRKQVSLEAKDIIEKAHKQAKQILDDAKIKIDAEQQKKEKEFNKRVELKARELLKEILGKDVELDKKLVQEVINK